MVARMLLRYSEFLLGCSQAVDRVFCVVAIMLLGGRYGVLGGCYGVARRFLGYPGWLLGCS